jgi:hypothetical protein
MRMWLYLSIPIIALIVYCAIFPGHLVEMMHWLFDDRMTGRRFPPPR